MDPDDFHKLAMGEVDAVHRLAYHLTDEPQEVGDFVQDTYLRALKAGATFTLTAQGIRPWLFKILHNVINTHVANRIRRPGLSGNLDDLPAGTIATPGMLCCDIGEVDWEHIDERLMRAIRDLPVHYRTVFLLSAVEGLRYNQIADVIDLPLTTVTNRLYRARQFLSSRLIDLAVEKRLVERGNLPPADGEGSALSYASHG